MGQTDPYPGLDALWRASADDLLAAAILLAGDRPSGEDLLQAALERTLRHWVRIQQNPEGYLRRCLYSLAVDGWRRRTRRPELLASPESLHREPQPGTEATERVMLRHVLLAALAQLPPRQRAVLVLRHFEHLTEPEAAEVLGCSVGAVTRRTLAGPDGRTVQQVFDLWFDPSLDRGVDEQWSDGVLLRKGGRSYDNGIETLFTIDYKHRTWHRTVQRVPGDIAHATGGFEIEAPEVAAALRGKGDFTLIGTEPIGTHAAYHLRKSPAAAGAAGTSGTAARDGASAAITVDVWVDRNTYQVLRASILPRPAQPLRRRR